MKYKVKMRIEFNGYVEVEAHTADEAKMIVQYGCSSTLDFHADDRRIKGYVLEQFGEKHIGTTTLINK